MTRECLLNSMPADELVMWQAFDELNPISIHYRVDLAAGVIASTNINKNVPADKKPTVPSDFMPLLHIQERETATKSMAPNDLRDLMRGIMKGQKNRGK